MIAVETTATVQQSSPPLQRPKLIIQSAHPTPLDNAAATQLQRDNVELKRQVHEHSDTVIALRRELAAAHARLSDVTGIFLPLSVCLSIFLSVCLYGCTLGYSKSFDEIFWRDGASPKD